MPFHGSSRKLGTATSPPAAERGAERELADGRPLRTPEKVFVALCMLGGYALAFLIVGEMHANAGTAGRMLHPRTALDAYIPFRPQFIYPYLAYYLWLLIPIPILRTRAQFYGAVYAFALTQMVALVIYVVFPSQMDRPLVLGDDLSARLVRLVYQVDLGYNVLPSLHVAHSVLVALLFYSLDPKRFPLVAMGSTLICVSTVLVKQHFIIDIPAGVAVAVACYYPTMALSHRMRRVQGPEDAALTS